MSKVRCNNCGKSIGKNRNRFCSNKCKNRFHNKTNPRGKFAHLNPDNQTADDTYKRDVCMEGEFGWDSHKGTGP